MPSKRPLAADRDAAGGGRRDARVGAHADAASGHADVRAATPSAPAATPTSAPTLSRRDAAGAPSARGLLFTLLGEFVLTGGGTAWTSAVIAAFARLGIEEKATRQALMRTAAAGWLRAEKSGRRTRWHLTDAARRLLTDGADTYLLLHRAGRQLGRALAACRGAHSGQ